MFFANLSKQRRCVRRDLQICQNKGVILRVPSGVGAALGEAGMDGSVLAGSIVAAWAEALPKISIE